MCSWFRQVWLIFFVCLQLIHFYLKVSLRFKIHRNRSGSFYSIWASLDWFSVRFGGSHHFFTHFSALVFSQILLTAGFDHYTSSDHMLGCWFWADLKLLLKCWQGLISLRLLISDRVCNWSLRKTCVFSSIPSKTVCHVEPNLMEEQFHLSLQYIMMPSNTLYIVRVNQWVMLQDCPWIAQKSMKPFIWSGLLALLGSRLFSLVQICHFFL